MTGYGKNVASEGNLTVTSEIRTLNSKQLDINLRVPPYLKEKEIDIRKKLASSLVRGKIDVSILIETSDTDSAPVIDRKTAMHYFKELEGLSNEMGINSSIDFIELIVKMPDVFVQKDMEVSDKEASLVLNCIDKAIASVDQARKSEGLDLEKDFKLRISNILTLLKDVDDYDQQRITKIRDRIKNNISKFLNNPETDKNRLEQEIIYYIEKLDITEERVRLNNNCNYFIENLNNKESSGKKLGFITQEIGREINTLGSKANDSDLQKIVVLMKDELEKIKEQLFNIL